MLIYRILSFITNNLFKFLLVIIGFIILQFLVRVDFGAHDIGYIASFTLSQFLIVFLTVYLIFGIQGLIKKRNKELEEEQMNKDLAIVEDDIVIESDEEKMEQKAEESQEKSEEETQTELEEKTKEKVEQEVEEKADQEVHTELEQKKDQDSINNNLK